MRSTRHFRSTVASTMVSSLPVSSEVAVISTSLGFKSPLAVFIFNHATFEPSRAKISACLQALSKAEVETSVRQKYVCGNDLLIIGESSIDQLRNHLDVLHMEHYLPASLRRDHGNRLFAITCHTCQLGQPRGPERSRNRCGSGRG